MENEITLTRRELYDRVWTTPIMHLAKEFGFSGVGLAKLCRRHNVPVPPRGYWAELRHGKNPPRPDLLPVTGRDEESIVLRSSENLKTEASLSNPLEPSKPRPVVEVKKTLRSIHPLLTHLTDKAPAKSIDDRGVFFLPYREKGISFPVSPALFRRTLLIADAIFRVCDERGWTIRKAERSYGPSEFDVTIVGEEIPVRIRERLREVKRSGDEYPRSRYEPTGVLELLIDSWAYRGRKRFVDGERSGLIEERLGEFIEAIEKTGQAERIRTLEREEENRRREEAQRRWEIEQERRRREAEKGRYLEEQAVRWSRAKGILDYLSAVKATHATGPDGPTPDIVEWLRWCESYAERLCPIQSGSYGPASVRSEEDDGIADE